MAPLSATGLHESTNGHHVYAHNDNTTETKGTNGTNGTNGMNGTNGHTLIGHTNGHSPNPPQTPKTTTPPIPIAITGMGMRLPGNCNDAPAFWDFLLAKREGMIPVPSSRWNLDGFHDPSGRPGTIKAKEGNFLDLDLGAFDGNFWSLTAAQVEQADPQHRILLETVYEALQNAGETGVKGGRVGVYVGIFAEDWIEMHSKDSEPLNFFGLTGHLDLMASNLVSYEFDWKGPSMTFKTGCSASMVALDAACKALASGDCDSAIVGGSNLVLSPGLSTVLSSYGVNSPEGRCRPFDADANGYGRGEAVSALYIKRLDHAVRDGNPIRAVIRASVCNDDGKTPGITQPNSKAHEAIIRDAYQSAGLSQKLGETGYFECHGTGTPVGDPLETNAVARVFGEHGGMVIGSVKSNVGHSESSSGNTSIIKSVLALEHLVIPPNVNFQTPNPKILWAEAKLSVATEPLTWPSDRKERVSVNSFGIGGSNAHVILESASSHGIPKPREAKAEEDSPRLALLLLSAKSEHSLQISIKDHEKYLETHGPACLGDLAYTLANRRDHHEQRTFAVSDGQEALIFRQSARALESSAPLVFVFTGQGAQWPEMGKQLIDDFPSVLQNFHELDHILSHCRTPPSWKLLDEIRKPKLKSKISQAEYSQPLCTAIQIVLVDLLRSWGVTSSAVAGHSSGEIAAAYCTGSLSKKEAILAAYFRGYATREQLSDGAMAAVGLGADQVRPYLTEGVVVACENSPESTTISGDRPAVEALIATLRRDAPDVFTRALQVDNAYHSHHMKAYGAAYESSISEITASTTPTIPFFSSVTGEKYTTAGIFTPSYWRRNLENPVLFTTAITNLLTDLSPPSEKSKAPLLFLEIGPHPALAGPLRQILTSTTATSPHPRPYTHLPTLHRSHDATASLLTTLGTLWTHSHPLSLTTLYQPSQHHVLTNLPTYPWDHTKSYWKESRPSREWRSRAFPPHETLGVRLPGTSALEPTWRAVVGLDRVGWVREHVVGGDIVFPGMGYVGMVGEAVRQLAGGDTSDGGRGMGYSVRGLTIKTAMIFVEGRENDVVTRLGRAKLNGRDESADWWDFSVTSWNGSVWSEHCSGQVRLGKAREDGDGIGRVREQVDHVRKVSAGRWYKTLAGLGFGYGPGFRGLKDISVDPVTGEATAVVDNTNTGSGSGKEYELHPCEMDKLLQLLIVAQHKGDPIRLTQLAMPTYFDEIYVSGRGVDKFRATATNEYDHMGTWTGHSFATAVDENGDSRLAFYIRGLSVSAMGSSTTNTVKPKNAVQLVWQPDIDLLSGADLAPLMRTPLDYREYHALLEKYFVLLALDAILLIPNPNLTTSSPATDQSPPDQQPQHQLQPHLLKFHAWLTRTLHLTSLGQNPLLPSTQGTFLFTISPAERTALLSSLSTTLSTSPVHSISSALHRIATSLPTLFTNTNALDLLTSNNLLTSLYAFFDSAWDYTPLLRTLGHKNPALRILEIGAGTGGTTRGILAGLVSPDSTGSSRLFSKYTYTDISSGFFPAAKERFSTYASDNSMEFRVLDITRDPIEQGFEEGGYDLVLAANVIHATACLGDTLRNVRKLVAPGGGRLLLQELDMKASWMGFIMGGFEGWWVGEGDGDGRGVDGPTVGVERWDRELREAGFTKGVEAVVGDDEVPWRLCNSMLCGVGGGEIKAEGEEGKKGVTVLYRGGEVVRGDVERYLGAFEEAGYVVSLVDFGDDGVEIPAGQDIISLLDLQGPFLDGIAERDFDKLRNLVAGLETTNIIWLTGLCSLGHVTDPRYAQILGLARTARSEKHISFTTVEVDSFVHPDALSKTVKIYDQTHKPSNHPELDPEFEFAVLDGVVHSSRYQWYSVPEELSRSAADSQDSVDKVLMIGQKGMIDSLRWEDNHMVKRPLRENEVSVRPHTVGVNFRDVLTTQGVVDGDDLGGECSGTVLEVGPGVTDFEVGDRVIMVGSYFFSNRVITSTDLIAKMPAGLSMEGAATVGIVFTTVLYSLLHLRRLEKGQTILIHSACGGVGIAAIQVAQMVGARVLATVGNEEKAQYLVDNYNIPRSQIFDSHSNAFADDVLAATNGHGVDIALNSLAGELLHATWKCIAPFGAMIEIGKRDFYGHGKVDMFQFTQNRAFIGMDARHIQTARPEICGQMMREYALYYEQGFLHPIPTFKNFPVTEIAESFRHMQRGTHIGKFTVTMPPDGDLSNLPLSHSTSSHSPLNLDPTSAYLLVGGLGGVGRSIASWFVSHGAKHLVFLSRSGRNPSNESFCLELEALGCTVQVFAGSVSDATSVSHAISHTTSPIRGVIQLSMALQDRALDTMTLPDWHTAIDPKVTGTWNLHHSLLSHQLDFFVMFASTSGVMGQYGQANYAAANCFLDAFTQYRHGLGLPASVIDLGVMEDVGFVAESAQLLDYFRFLDADMLSEQDMRDAVRLAMARSFPPSPASKQAGSGSTNPSQIGVGVLSYMPLSDPANRIIWKRDRRFAAYRSNVEREMGNGRAGQGDASGAGDTLKTFLAQVSSAASRGELDEAEAVASLSKEIGKTLYGFMMKNTDEMQLDRPLAALGLDSLVAIELRNYLRNQVGVDVSVLEIMQSTLGGLAERALEFLVAK